MDDARPTEALCRPLYAANGEAGEPGIDDTDDRRDVSAGEATEGIV